QDYPNDADYQDVVAELQGLHGCLLLRARRAAEADESFRHCRAALEKLTREHSDCPRYRGAFGTFLAVCPIEGLRDPARTLEMAGGPDDPARRFLAGIAHYRLGNWAASRREPTEPGDALAACFLAMSLCRLGEAEEARRYYDLAGRLSPHYHGQQMLSMLR